MHTHTLAYRGTIIHCLGDPGLEQVTPELEIIEDGLLVVYDGHIKALGSTEIIAATLDTSTKTIDYRGQLIVPGFIDTHIHYPQTDIIASYGAQLLDWLEQYTYPIEENLSNKAYAAELSDFFIRELLKNGTTTAAAYTTIHSNSVDAIFSAASAHGLRLIAGKVLMDRNCPENLRDTAISGYEDSLELIEKWHNNGRLSYALTPRFAATSSVQQLELTGKLARDYPDTYIQTHLAENAKEIAWVAELFPNNRSYLDVYRQYGLTRKRAIFGHCIHIDDEDRQLMQQTDSAIAFCPTSNLFLGSGLFDLDAALTQNIRVGLATDIGAGTSFSMLKTMAEAYKVLQLNQQPLTAYRALYLATLGGALALDLEDKVGNLVPGKEADFVVLNTDSTELLARRTSRTDDLHEKLFALIMLGDERCISATYCLGQKVYDSKLDKTAV